MKLFESQQIRKLDAYTVEHEPISYIDLMERSAKVMTDWIIGNYSNSKKIFVFAGTGNNGGDALAMSRLLVIYGYDINVFLFNPFNKPLSSECKINYERLIKDKRVSIKEIINIDDFQLSDCDFILDGLLGTGLSRPLDGIFKDLINKINQSGKMIVSIDIPSGLGADMGIIEDSICAIKATHTLTLQIPKMVFFIPESSQFVGSFHILDININKQGILQTETNFYYTQKEDVPSAPIRNIFAHKGVFGHALFIGGSMGKMGAAVMASKACMRSGVGLTTALVPVCGLYIMQISVPEVMCITNGDNAFLANLPISGLENYDAIGIGCGLGTEKFTISAMCAMLPVLRKPIVIDADALNILSQKRSMFMRIPKNSILTPHPKEWQRITGCSMNRNDQICVARKFCKEHELIVVLKGAYTAVILPNGDVHFNSTGNPGMATAGSGDVLCGIILSLLAQGMKPADAAIRGVYIHGAAGDEAVKEKGMSAMIATDIIEHL